MFHLGQLFGPATKTCFEGVENKVQLHQMMSTQASLTPTDRADVLISEILDDLLVTWSLLLGHCM